MSTFMRKLIYFLIIVVCAGLIVLYPGAEPDTYQSANLENVSVTPIATPSPTPTPTPTP